MVGCLNNYRHDLRRGVNPFEGAFPLWRNEQFRAATMSDDPNELERFAAVERAVMSAAEREETIALNARDAARGAAIDDDATRVTLGLSAPGSEAAGGRLPEAVVADAPEKESRAAAERTEVVDPNALDSFSGAFATTASGRRPPAASEPGALNPSVTRVASSSIAAPRACLLYTSPSPRDATLSRMPSSA